MQLCRGCRRLARPADRTCQECGGDTETVSEPPIGARIGVYRIDRVLGEGGMGFVYEATHTTLNRRTAMKFLRPEFVQNPDVVARFLREAQAVNVITHEHIVNVYDYGDGSDGCVYFVMEYLEGETLGDLMSRFKPMSLPLVLHVYGQLLSALDAAHAKGIVHRDLKPANAFIVTRSNNPYFLKLLDFGVAKLLDGDVQKLTSAGQLIGTPQYMSPEQMSGGAIDARSDLFTVGIMLYRAVTGHQPFDGTTFGALAQQIMREDPTPPSAAAADGTAVPRSLERLILKALAKKPEARHQSAAEMLAELEQVKQEAGISSAALRELLPSSGAGDAEWTPSIVDDGTLARSNPVYQGVSQTVVEAAAKAVETGRSWLPAVVALGGLTVAALAIYLVFFRGGDSAATAAPPPAVSEAAPTAGGSGPAVPSGAIQQKLAADDRAGARALADAGLREAVTSGDAAAQAEAVAAMALVGAPRSAPLLYLALGGAPALRVQAARGLATMGLPDAAPRVREALGSAGNRVRVELAAVLLALGDPEARPILLRGLEDPATRHIAAVALAAAGVEREAARPILREAFEQTPRNRETWREAAGGLRALADPAVDAALRAELAHPDPARSVAVAELLARAGDEAARGYLGRVVEDAAFGGRADAAVALARLGDDGGLAFVADGLASEDVAVRQRAIAVAARFARGGGASYLPAIAAAAEDRDRSVRYAAFAALLWF
jgi:serine/threonine protein kinase/HEAT repeat protein